MLADGRVESYAHRISWMVRNGDYFPDGKESCHSCNTRSCCNPMHIRPGTHQENIDDRRLFGKPYSLRGERVANAKLTDDAVQRLWRLHVIGRKSQREIAALLGVSQVAVNHVLNGKTWKHVKIPAFMIEQGMLLYS